MNKNQVHQTQSVRQRSQTIPWESYLALEKCKTELEQNDRLVEGIPLGDRFGFSVDNDWVVITQRQECQNWRGHRMLKITLIELMSVEEFGRWITQNSAQSSSLQLADTHSTPEAAGGISWMGMLVKAIGLLFSRPNTLLVWVTVVIPISLVAIACNYKGTVEIQIKTDGDRNVAGEVTIDGRQSR